MSIVPRLGANVGGGKINAVFKRMNLLCDRAGSEVVLLNLQHSVNQKIAFADLLDQGVFDPRIQHRSFYEFCAGSEQLTKPNANVDLPHWDQQVAKSGAQKQRVSYFDGDTPVMRDIIEQTAAGQLTIRQVLTSPAEDVRLKYLGNTLVERVRRYGDGMVEKTFFDQGHALCDLTYEHKVLRHAKSYVTGATYDSAHTLQKALAAHAFPHDSVVFIDGVTTAYLSRNIKAQKVLFLHADHRAPNRTVVPRSQFLIEKFDGDAIVTATHAHKTRLEADTKHAAPIRVIPHYTDTPNIAAGTRADICTVSRLELDGKPIHQCIEAFTRVMHLIPDCNYLIYGSGLGKGRLEQLITHHNCADRVFLMGHTPDAAQVFASSLFSLAPTMTEGFGLALLESITQDCPVISYDVDYGPRELVRSGQNGVLVKPGDIDAIANAILTVHRNREAYAKACAPIAERYSFEVYRKNYMALMDDLLGRPSFFDITAEDLRLQTAHALETAPQRHKARLLDLYIKLSTDKRDLAGAYWGFQQKLRLFPKVQRPLMRCIWLSRRLGKLDACQDYLALFAHRFPDNHADFIARYPDFLEVADAPHLAET